MKLSITTYEIVKEWGLPYLIEQCCKLGIGGMEFRTDQKHGHGVEVSLTKEQRREIRERIEDAYLAAVGIASPCRFDSPDKTILRKEIDHAKACVELCADVGGRTVRVFGNDFKPGTSRKTIIEQVGASLAELIPFGREHGVEVLLEMHGQFNYWGFALGALKASEVQDAGLIYNCDLRDLVGGSITQTYSMVREKIKHVHIHEFYSGFPYPEFFQLLKNDGYNGFMSAEISASTDPERVLAYYAAMYKMIITNLI